MTDVNKLIELEPFADSTIDTLESIVSKQLSGEVPYSFEVNKLLMKNYQVKPVRANVNFIVDILLLSVMHLPSTDYLALSYIVPVKFRPERHATVQTIANLVKALEQSQFAQFWQLFTATSSESLKFPASFESTIRNFILGAIKSSYKFISLQTFSAALNISVEAGRKLCSSDSQLTLDGEKVGVSVPVAIEAVTTLKSEVVLDISKISAV